MAIQIDKNTVEVVSGDTLSHIALKFLGSASKYPELAKINNISNANLIFPGQRIKLRATTVPKRTGTKAATAVVTNLLVQSGTERTVYATWTWDNHEETEKYEYEWEYDSGDSPTQAWFFGGSGDSGKRQHVTFTAPENAKQVRFKVKPIPVTNETEKEA